MPTWGADLSTIEGPKRLLAVEFEFASVLRVACRDGNTVSAGSSPCALHTSKPDSRSGRRLATNTTMATRTIGTSTTFFGIIPSCQVARFYAVWMTFSGNPCLAGSTHLVDDRGVGFGAMVIGALMLFPKV